jgi:hypothetical protein
VEFWLVFATIAINPSEATKQIQTENNCTAVHKNNLRPHVSVGKHPPKETQGEIRGPVPTSLIHGVIYDLSSKEAFVFP